MFFRQLVLELVVELFNTSALSQFNVRDSSLFIFDDRPLNSELETTVDHFYAGFPLFGREPLVKLLCNEHTVNRILANHVDIVTMNTRNDNSPFG